MTRGYHFPTDPNSWEALQDEFEWTVPDRYDIAMATLDHHQDDRTALVHVDLEGNEHSFTYGEVDDASDAVAAALSNRDFARGDKLAFCLPQCPELLVGYLAAFKLGAVAVPLSMLAGEESAAYTVQDSDATAVVIDDQKYDDLGAPDWPSVEETVSVAPAGNEYRTGPAGELPTGESSRFERAVNSPEDPAMILYTSGTTGQPKGVVQGHQYLIGSLPGWQCYFQLFDPEEMRDARVWSPSEWAWAGALFNVVFPTLATGGTVVSSVRRSGFDPDRALGLIERARVSHAFMPPTALERIRSGSSPSRYDLSSFQVCQCGGEALSPTLLEWGEANLDIVINEAYGQTEANALVGNCQALFGPEHGSMGRAFPGHDVTVVDSDGEPCDVGELGEIAVRVPNPVVFNGYYDDEVATEEKYLTDDLFRTDDMAVVDENGYFWHRGRADDLVITAGYRVSPYEVERVLERNESVATAVVGGVADDERGNRIKAYVIPEDGIDSVGEEFERRLRSFVREQLAAFKAPDEFEFLESLPTTTSDKTDRSALFDDSGDGREPAS